MIAIPRDKAERNEGDGFFVITAPVGTIVALGYGWYTRITGMSTRCDCGKGVGCIHNQPERWDDFL